eukprot:110888-Prymnesium_polylepis.1
MSIRRRASHVQQCLVLPRTTNASKGVINLIDAAIALVAEPAVPATRTSRSRMGGAPISEARTG